jgi:hypothetical protein
MTDQPMPPRRSEDEEFKRVVYGHMDAIRTELRQQEERLDRVQYMMQQITETLEHKVGFESLVYAWCGGGFIGLIIGVSLGWAWR